MNEYGIILKKLEKQYGREIYLNGNKLINVFQSATNNSEMVQIFKCFIYVRGNKMLAEDRSRAFEVVNLMQEKYSCKSTISKLVCDGFLQAYYGLKQPVEKRKSIQKIMDYDMNDVLKGIQY